MTTIPTKIHNYLKSRTGQLVTTEEIIAAVYGDSHPVDQYSKAKVRVHLAKVRQVMGDQLETHTSYKFNSNG